MASLVDRNGHYYAQFYDASRQPKRKQIPLNTGRRRVGERLLARLEDEYALGEFDPWNPDDTREDLEQLGAAVEAFIETPSHFSPHTVRKYHVVLGQLARHVGAEHPTGQLSPRDIQRFLDSGERKPPTKKSYSNAIKAFCNWLIEQDVLTDNPVGKVRLPRVPDKHPRFLTREEVDHLIQTRKTLVFVGGYGDTVEEVIANKGRIEQELRNRAPLDRKRTEALESMDLPWETVDVDARALTHGVRRVEAREGEGYFADFRVDLAALDEAPPASERRFDDEEEEVEADVVSAAIEETFPGNTPNTDDDHE